MLLRIELEEGPYLADVGFGGETPTAPLRLAPDTPQATPHERFRVRPEGDGFVVEAEIRARWQVLAASLLVQLAHVLRPGARPRRAQA